MKNAYKSLVVLLMLSSIVACNNSNDSGMDPMEDSTVVDEETPMDLLVGEDVSYSTESTNMNGYKVHSKNFEGKRPGIIVVHEWWGHNDYVRNRADKLAELGYTAIAIDMYGEGAQAKHPLDAGKFSNMVMSNIDEAQDRFEAALETLKKDPTVDTNQIAAIGYCFGGSVALTMANAGFDLDAVAAFHSGVDLPIMPNENLKARVLVCNGEDDPFVKQESAVKYKEALATTGVKYKYIDYPGAVHAFTSKAADSLGKKFDLPLAYNLDADEQSWEELKSMLSEVFNK